MKAAKLSQAGIQSDGDILVSKGVMAIQVETASFSHHCQVFQQVIKGQTFNQIGEFESLYWDLLPKKQYYGPHSDRRHHNEWDASSFVLDMHEELANLKKVSNDKVYWELSDVKWEVDNFRLMVTHTLYRVPMGFVVKKALAGSIQAIINGEKCVRKCTLCDRIFRVPKVNGDLKKYCGSGCRTKASKARSISTNDK